jgi:hypothetical protein
MTRLRLIAAIAAALLSCGIAPATGGTTPTLVERIELWIELPAQQRFVAAKSTPDAELAPFVSDGCSGGLSAGWAFAAEHLPQLAAVHGEHPPWEACCVEHDRAYHSAPGEDAVASFAERRAADETMRLCVLAEGREHGDVLMERFGLSAAMADLLYEGIAAAMYRAVRLGGAPCSPLPWRWGYGWPRCD